MNITKCNRCKTVIKNSINEDNSSVRIYAKEHIWADFCARCTPKLANFIKKYTKLGKKK